MTDKVMVQKAPWPYALETAVAELKYFSGWKIYLREEPRGQGCSGLTLSIVPDNPDAYHPERPAHTRFLYPVPAAAYNRESWEEWLWARIEETEGHERAEAFKFVSSDGLEYRPFKPVHTDGWDPGIVRRVVTEEQANVPNAGRFVYFPCRACGHLHKGKMGEHFTVSNELGCVEDGCACGKTVGAKTATKETGEVEVFIDDLKFVVAPGWYAGLDIRHFMHPPLSNDYDLYFVNEEGHSFIVLPTNLKHIHAASHFRTEKR